MGRSVSVPSGASQTVYIELDQDEDFWEDFIDGLKYTICKHWPSFDDCDRWTEREAHAILENGHADIVVCEYCGLVSVSLVPVDGHYGRGGYYDGLGDLHNHWVNQIGDRFAEVLNETYNGLNRIGTMSNGVSVYQRAS